MKMAHAHHTHQSGTRGQKEICVFVRRTMYNVLFLCVNQEQTQAFDCDHNKKCWQQQ